MASDFFAYKVLYAGKQRRLVGADDQSRECLSLRGWWAPSEKALFAELVKALAEINHVPHILRILAQQHLKGVVVDPLQDVLDFLGLAHRNVDTFAKVDNVFYIAGKIFALLLCPLPQALLGAKFAHGWATEDFCKTGLEG